MNANVYIKVLRGLFLEIGHQIILDNFLKVINDKDIKHILDAGSGRTSLSTIINIYRKLI
jgi:hypothetical protein